MRYHRTCETLRQFVGIRIKIICESECIGFLYDRHSVLQVSRRLVSEIHSGYAGSFHHLKELKTCTRNNQIKSNQMETNAYVVGASHRIESAASTDSRRKFDSFTTKPVAIRKFYVISNIDLVPTELSNPSTQPTSNLVVR